MDGELIMPNLKKPRTLVKLAHDTFDRQSVYEFIYESTAEQYRLLNIYLYGPAHTESFLRMTPEQASYFILFLATLQGEI